ncbi:MAG: DeoR family transcriptional regulator [Legionellales bacterium]|nr:DeoR family transcriptional regulator [Legionellales bacterium]
MEFKKSTTQLKSAAESLCAFLNTHGGLVFIGVLQNGDVVGQHISDATQQEIANLMQKFEPHASINISYISVPNTDKKVIVMQALPHPNEKPYIFDGRPYYREQSSTIQMPQSRYQQQLIHRQNHPLAWDKQTATDYAMEDLDHERIINVFQQSIKRERIPANSATDDIHEILWRMKLLRENKLTNAAVVLFCKEAMPLYSQCLVKLASFRDQTKRDFIDSQQIYGNLFYLYEISQEFLRRHTSIASHFISTSDERIDIPDYPLLAVREALINAFCHRDYATIGGAVTVSIYPDSLEITSHGNLPNGLTPELLKVRHDSQPRNSLMADVLYRCGLIETYGTGTQEIVRICQEEGRPEPDFIERANVVVVKMYKASIKQPQKQSQQNELSERQKTILTLLENQPFLTNQQIMAELKLAERTLRRDLVSLSSLSLIESKGVGRAKEWFIKK